MNVVLPKIEADILEQFRESAVSYDWRLWLAAIVIGAVLLGAGWHIYRVCLVLSGIVCGVIGGSLLLVAFSWADNAIHDTRFGVHVYDFAFPYGGEDTDIQNSYVVGR